jgi:hypothetical protein
MAIEGYLSGDGPSRDILRKQRGAQAPMSLMGRPGAVIPIGGGRHTRVGGSRSTMFGATRTFETTRYDVVRLHGRVEVVDKRPNMVDDARSRHGGLEDPAFDAARLADRLI